MCAMRRVEAGSQFSQILTLFENSPESRELLIHWVIRRRVRAASTVESDRTLPRLSFCRRSLADPVRKRFVFDTVVAEREAGDLIVCLQPS